MLIFSPDSPFPASHFLSLTISKKTLVSQGLPSSPTVPGWLPEVRALSHCWTQYVRRVPWIPSENSPTLVFRPMRGASTIIKVTEYVACSLTTRDQIVKVREKSKTQQLTYFTLNLFEAAWYFLMTPTHFPTHLSHPYSSSLTCIQLLASNMYLFAHYPDSPNYQSTLYMLLNPFAVTSCIMVICGINVCGGGHLFPFILSYFSVGKQILWLTCWAMLLHDVICRCVHLYCVDGWILMVV